MWVHILYGADDDDFQQNVIVGIYTSSEKMYKEIEKEVYHYPCMKNRVYMCRRTRLDEQVSFNQDSFGDADDLFLRPVKEGDDYNIYISNELVESPDDPDDPDEQGPPLPQLAPQIVHTFPVQQNE